MKMQNSVLMPVAYAHCELFYCDVRTNGRIYNVGMIKNSHLAKNLLLTKPDILDLTQLREYVIH